MRTANPILNEKTFADYAESVEARSLPTEGARTMTLEGTAMKAGFLLLLVFAGAAVSWNLIAAQPEAKQAAYAMPFWIGGALGGLVLALIISFKRNLAPILSGPYAIVEGLFLGALSMYANTYYKGVVPQAVGLTFFVAFSLLVAYRFRIVKATENFKLGVMAATGGIMLLYGVTFLLSFFGVAVPYIHGNGVIGIGFSVFVVIIAALNLVLDFDFIENAVEHRMPKKTEWFAAFGLLVTLVWLYIEILRLLMKLQSRD